MPRFEANIELDEEETSNLRPLRSDIEPPLRSSSWSRSRPSVLSCMTLVTVPVLWGTFTPSMKMLLDSKHAPPVIITNLASHFVGSAALAVVWAMQAVPRRKCLPVDNAESDNLQARHALWASCELGIYLFFGQLTQLVGLVGTTATTNAII